MRKEKSNTHNDDDRGREPAVECIGITTSVEVIGLNKSSSSRSTWQDKKIEKNIENNGDKVTH